MHKEIKDEPADVAAKRGLRADARARREKAARRLSPRDAGIRAAERVDELLAWPPPAPPGGVIAFYWPVGDEFDPRPLIEQCLARGYRAALPKIIAPGTALAFHLYRLNDNLLPGVLGLREPDPAYASAVRPDLVLLPLLAFDPRNGARLGQGGGYYDRTLAVLRDGRRPPPAAVGLAYEAQGFTDIPMGMTDQFLDAVLHENGFATFV